MDIDVENKAIKKELNKNLDEDDLKSSKPL